MSRDAQKQLNMLDNIRGVLDDGGTLADCFQCQFALASCMYCLSPYEITFKPFSRHFSSRDVLVRVR